MKRVLFSAIVATLLTSGGAFARTMDMASRDLKTLYKMCRYPQSFGFQRPIEDLSVDCSKTEMRWQMGPRTPVKQLGDDCVTITGTLLAKKRYIEPGHDAVSGTSKDEFVFQSVGRSTLAPIEEVMDIPMYGERVQWNQVETKFVGQGSITCEEFVELFDQMGQNQNIIEKVCTDKFNVNWYPVNSGRVVKSLIL